MPAKADRVKSGFSMERKDLEEQGYMLRHTASRRGCLTSRSTQGKADFLLTFQRFFRIMALLIYYTYFQKPACQNDQKEWIS